MKEEKNAKVQSMPIRKTNCIRIFISLGGAANCRIFLFIGRIVGDILCDIVLPHATLVAKEEHLINLLLVIFLQLLLFNSETGLELL